jgi:hypothetical protein
MKNKKIIQIIKKKADQVNVPDLSQIILSKIQDTPVIKPKIDPVRAPFNRRLALVSFSFVLLLAVAFFAFLNPSLTYEFKAQDDVMLMSSIYAEGLYTDDLEANSKGDVSLDTEVLYVGLELPKIASYMTLVETRLGLQSLPDIHQSSEDDMTVLTFFTRQGSADEKTYVLRYQTSVIDPRKDLFVHTGTLTSGLKTLPFRAQSVFEDGHHGLMFTLGNQETDGILITYDENDSERPFDAQIYNEGTMKRRIELSTLSESSHQFTMHFTEGDVLGTYLFEHHDDPQAHDIDVTYAILKGTDTETGTMRVTLDGSPGQETIRFEIHARGKAAYDMMFGHEHHGQNDDQL